MMNVEVIGPKVLNPELVTRTPERVLQDPHNSKFVIRYSILLVNHETHETHEKITKKKPGGCPRTGIVARKVDATLRSDPLRVEDDPKYSRI